MGPKVEDDLKAAISKCRKVVQQARLRIKRGKPTAGDEELSQWRIAQEGVPYAWATMWLMLAAYLLVRILRCRCDRRIVVAFAVACAAAVYTDPLTWLVVGAFWLIAFGHSVWVGDGAQLKPLTVAVLAASLSFAPWLPLAGRWWQLQLASLHAGGRLTAIDLAREMDLLIARRVGLVEPDRPDFRAVVGYLQHRAMPNEAVILVGGHSFPMFDYYAKGRWDTYPLPARLASADPTPLEAAQVASRLDRMVEDGHRRVWLVRWQAETFDPEGLTLALLSANGRPTTIGERFHGVEMDRFELPKGTVFAGQAPVKR